MKKLNLTKEIKELSGETVIGKDGKPLMLNEVLGNLICQAKAENDAVRQLTVAQAIYGAKGEIELEDADFDMLEKVVAKSPLTTLVAAQVLSILKEAKK